MKVLHISRTMGQGGAEKVVRQLCEGVDSVTHLVISTGGVNVAPIEAAGAKHFTMPDIDCHSPFNMLRCFFAILKAARREKADILHSHHRMAAFYARVIALFLNVRRVYTAHNVFTDRRWLTRFALRGSAIVAVGDSVKDNLTGFYGIEAERVTLVRNSVRMDSSRTAHDNALESLRASGVCLAGAIGRLTRQKGMDTFIRAVALCSETVTAVIIGDGEERASLEQLAAGPGMERRVIFLGYREDIPALMRQLDFVVLPSRWEGLPLVPIEAFACGKAVIASDIPGNSDIVTDGENGLLFPVDDPEALAACINRLSADRALRERLESAALESYKKNYRCEDFLEGYRNIYTGKGTDR